MIPCSLCDKPAKVVFTGTRKTKYTYKDPLCSGHYEKLRRYGDPTVQRASPSPIKGRVFRKGGERYNKGDGYVIVWMPDHPNANLNGYLGEHTLVMSNHLGRPLKKGESVHHKNGIRNDNRIEDLELWTKPPRKGVRVEDAIKDCIKFLEEYGYKIEQENEPASEKSHS